MKAELAQLIFLQKTDLNIRRLKSDIESIPQRRAEIEAEFDQRAFEIRALETAHDTAHAERTRLQAELTEAQGRIERAERNLMAAQNEQGYAAALREADTNRKQVATLETQVVEISATVETTAAELATRKPEIDKLRVELKAKFKAFDKQTVAESAELASEKIERTRVLATLPKPLAAVYDRLATRSKDGIAVAEARSGACTACFMALRPQMMSLVRAGTEILTCENCGRILYFVAAEQVPSAAVS